MKFSIFLFDCWIVHKVHGGCNKVGRSFLPLVCINFFLTILCCKLQRVCIQ
jgi:hypothetical protein